MASGNTLNAFTAQSNQPPSSTYATFGVRNNHAILEFDAATSETAYFEDVLPSHYSGGGLTVELYWMAATATSGDAVWEVSVERNESAGTDLDSDSFATAQTATTTTSGTSGAINKTTITFTSGAQMDSLAAGEPFRLRVVRNGGSGSDTMTGDAQLSRVHIKET